MCVYVYMYMYVYIHIACDAIYTIPIRCKAGILRMYLLIIYVLFILFFYNTHNLIIFRSGTKFYIWILIIYFHLYF